MIKRQPSVIEYILYKIGFTKTPREELYGNSNERPSENYKVLVESFRKKIYSQ